MQDASYTMLIASYPSEENMRHVNHTTIPQKRKAATPAGRLTVREHEVLILIAEGLTSQQIAERLFVCLDTIESHRKKIIKKLGVNNIAQAVAHGFRNNLLQ